jgi:hypothetical protein
MLSKIAGKNKSLQIEKYKTGRMHDVVYDVYGGFEDWVYGGSIEPQFLT